MPASPELVSATACSTLARPSLACRRLGWLTLVSLLLFVLSYLALAGWFLWTAYRLAFERSVAAYGAPRALGVAALALLLAVLLLKAVVLRPRNDADTEHQELTPVEQPELFSFLRVLAAQAHAPVPDRVFASPSMTAGVFRKPALRNLFAPPRQGLDIGLGLVNVLSLGELRAVLLHELGHLAYGHDVIQRWIGVAGPFATHLNSHRDRLDEFVRRLRYSHRAVSWVGSLLQLAAWSIRSLIDAAFRAATLARYAMSREAELNADLLAVSLTGSDALTHALHKMNAAQAVWRRTCRFVLEEKARGRLTRDVYAVQTQMAALMPSQCRDPDHGRVPPVPAASPETHRIFESALAEPPRRWQSHPPDDEREENAKRHYLRGEIDDRSAWALFAEPQALREALSARMLGEGPPTEGLQSTAARVRRRFERTFHDRRYRGVYVGRAIARHAAVAAELCDAGDPGGPAALDSLYPESLAVDVTRRDALRDDLALLRELQARRLCARGGVVRYGGQVIGKAELPSLISRLEQEEAALEAGLRGHDRRCRSVHHAIAVQLGHGWAAHLEGLLAVLHHGERAGHRLRKKKALLSRAVGQWSAALLPGAAFQNVFVAAQRLHENLERFHAEASEVHLDPTLLDRLETDSWCAFLGEHGLAAPERRNLLRWIRAYENPLKWAIHACDELRDRALEELVSAESALARHWREGSDPGEAPVASRLPAAEDRQPGSAAAVRPEPDDRSTRWKTLAARATVRARLLAPAARWLTAVGIVAGILGFPDLLGRPSITIYNGLGRPVSVTVGAHGPSTLPALASMCVETEATDRVRIETRTLEGDPIEAFDADVSRAFPQYVYNVAGAAPLLEWTLVDGERRGPPEGALGAPRWTHTFAKHLFPEAPPAAGEVLSALVDEPPAAQLDAVGSQQERARMIAAHARWDRPDAPFRGEWLRRAAALLP